MLLSLVVKNLRTGTARSGIAHLPKVIFIPKTHNTLFGDMLLPKPKCLFVIFMHSHPHFFNRKRQILRSCHKLPSIGYSLLFEIIPEREISQHLKKGVVSSGIAHIIKIIVFAACADTKLRRGGARRLRHRRFTGKDTLELHHARIGKKECSIVRNERRTRYNLMPFGVKKI